MSRPWTADGFDEAIVGIDLNYGRVAYSKQKMLEILIERDGMSWEEAYEFAEYNIWCAWIGEQTPIYLDDYDVVYQDFDFGTLDED